MFFRRDRYSSFASSGLPLDCALKQSVTVDTARLWAVSGHQGDAFGSKYSATKLPAYLRKTKPNLCAFGLSISESSLPLIYASNSWFPFLPIGFKKRNTEAYRMRRGQKLRTLAAEFSTEPPVRLQKENGQAAGTRLLRSWHGEMHEVNVLAGAFEYRGQTYTSLSKIASEITGTRWSGPLFFGTRKAQL